MSQHFNIPLEFELKPSRLLTAILVASHVGAMASIMAVPGPIPAKVLFLIPLMVSAFYSIRRYALIVSGQSVCKVLFKEHDCRVIRRNALSEDALLVFDQCINTRSIIALKLTADGKSYWIPIFRDMLASDVFRRLRVYLKTRSE
ncbi:MAG: hypothetical protein JXA04_01915 [Gammaproteobacteria bacterium]|nr:hypothetical protein [Gammaproteobacteria bacterium]